MAIPLGRPSPGASRDLPGRLTRKPAFPPWRERRPYLVLLPVGFTVPPPLPAPRCALTAPFHPHPQARGPGGQTALCGTFPGVAPAGHYPAPCFRGARTFLPRVAPGAAIRPPDPSLNVAPPRPRFQAPRNRRQQAVQAGERLPVGHAVDAGRPEMALKGRDHQARAVRRGGRLAPRRSRSGRGRPAAATRGARRAGARGAAKGRRPRRQGAPSRTARRGPACARARRRCARARARGGIGQRSRIARHSAMQAAYCASVNGR